MGPSIGDRGRHEGVPPHSGRPRRRNGPAAGHRAGPRLATRFVRSLAASLVLASAFPAGSAEVPRYPDHHDLLYYLDSAGRRHAVQAEAEWAKRRAHVVASFEAVAGPLPSGTKAPLRLEVLDEVREEGYRRQLVTYEALAGDPIPAYLFLPDRPGRRPAVLALHPTGALGKGIPAGLGDRPNRNYAQELARRGWVVLAPDYVYMGDPQRDPYELGYASGTMKGIYNHVRGVDLLASLPEVDERRIGAIGHSLGGHNSLFVALFDQRVRAVVTSCGFNSFAKYKGGDLTGWSSSKYMPRIATLHGKDPARMPFDFTEILAAIAPRAVFISAPTGDANFEVSGVRDCVRAARPVFQGIFSAGDRLVAVHPDCGHDFPPDIRERAYAFLERWLAPGTR